MTFKLCHHLSTGVGIPMVIRSLLRIMPFMISPNNQEIFGWEAGRKFIIPILYLHFISHSIFFLIDFLWFSKLKRALGSLTKEKFHQDLAQNSHLIGRTTFFTIQELINMIQISFPGKFSDFLFFMHCPSPLSTEKTLIRN